MEFYGRVDLNGGMISLLLAFRKDGYAVDALRVDGIPDGWIAGARVFSFALGFGLYIAISANARSLFRTADNSISLPASLSCDTSKYRCESFVGRA